METEAIISAKPNVDRAPLSLRIGFWACTAIAVAVVVRRISTLAFPPRSAPPQLAALDSFFASHAPLTLAHIIPALAFVLVAPLVVFRASALFAWPGRLIYPLGALVGLTAYAMNVDSVGGWIERSAVLVFDTLFLISLIRAFRYRQDKNQPRERRWLLRAIAVLLGIATTRPVMGVFFATSPLTHLTPTQFFGIAFWIGFSINALIFELWLRSRDRKSQAAAPHSVDGFTHIQAGKTL
jgi:uncharacterized membrane protein YsdA (DUF1294 family)